MPTTASIIPDARPPLPPNGLFYVSQITTTYNVNPAGLGIAAAGIISSAAGFVTLPEAIAQALAALSSAVSIAGIWAPSPISSNNFYFDVSFAVASPQNNYIFVTLVGSNANVAQSGASGTAAYPMGVVLNASSSYYLGVGYCNS